MEKFPADPVTKSGGFRKKKVQLTANRVEFAGIHCGKKKSPESKKKKTQKVSWLFPVNTLCNFFFKTEIHWYFHKL